jgi:hypothetical protein
MRLNTRKPLQKIALGILACTVFATGLTGCASKRKPASDTSELDKVQYEKYVRKVERQDARFSERLSQ